MNVTVLRSLTCVSIAMLTVVLAGCGGDGKQGGERTPPTTAKASFGSTVRDCASTFNSQIGSGGGKAAMLWNAMVDQADGVEDWAGQVLANQDNCMIYAKGLHPTSGVVVNAMFTRFGGGDWSVPQLLECDLGGKCPSPIDPAEVDASAEAELDGGTDLRLLTKREFDTRFGEYNLRSEAGIGDTNIARSDETTSRDVSSVPPTENRTVHVIATDLTADQLTRAQIGFDDVANLCEGLKLPKVTWVFRATDCNGIDERWQAGLIGFECTTYAGADGTPNTIYWCLGTGTGMRGQYVEARKIATTPAIAPARDKAVTDCEGFTLDEGGRGRGGQYYYWSNVSARNMTCDAVRDLLGTRARSVGDEDVIVDGASFGGFTCKQVGEGIEDWTFRCVSGRRAFRASTGV